MRHLLHPLLLILAPLILCTACYVEHTVEPILYVSIEPLRYVTEALAGDRYEVRTLTPKGANPETYSPTMQQMHDMSQCTAFIRMGTLGFERTQLRGISENCPHLYIVNAAEKVPGAAPCSDDEKHHDDMDPHAWMSPRNMNIMAFNIYKALCHIDHRNAAFYEQRLNAFLLHSDSLSQIIRERLSAVRHHTFLINHPSLGHYASQYGLRQISVEHEGKEASAERVAWLIDECRRDSVTKVLIQIQHSARTTEAIATQLHLQPIRINPLSYDWDKELLHITDQLCQ